MVNIERIKWLGNNFQSLPRFRKKNNYTSSLRSLKFLKTEIERQKDILKEKRIVEERYEILKILNRTIRRTQEVLEWVVGPHYYEEFEQDKQYSYEKRGQKTIKVRSEEFSAAYQQMLNGMVERRLRKSVKTIGDLWYSAWVDAGQPILEGMLESEHPYVEEIILDHKISKEDARGHQH